MGGGIGGLLYTRDADGSLAYFHYDGQGNVVSVTDEAREEIAYYEYDAWGNLLTACGSFANEFAFSTKQASTGTGLIDFGYRHYDPHTGRWTQRDPLGVVGSGPNLYPYAASAPTNHFDDRGHVIRTWNQYGQSYVWNENTWNELVKKAEAGKQRYSGVPPITVCSSAHDVLAYLYAYGNESLRKVIEGLVKSNEIHVDLFPRSYGNQSGLARFGMAWDMTDYRCAKRSQTPEEKKNFPLGEYGITYDPNYTGVLYYPRLEESTLDVRHYLVHELTHAYAGAGEELACAMENANDPQRRRTTHDGDPLPEEVYSDPEKYLKENLPDKPQGF